MNCFRVFFVFFRGFRVFLAPFLLFSFSSTRGQNVTGRQADSIGGDGQYRRV